MDKWFLQEIYDEYVIASKKFKKFNSRHEGYAVIKEEVDELWDAIKGNFANNLVRKEAIQVGAMALRFLIDCQAPQTEAKAPDAP